MICFVLMVILLIGGGCYMNNSNNLQRVQHKGVPVASRAALTGFLGGIFWGLIGSALYYFNFSEVSAKSFLLSSWLKADWTDKWLGHLVAIMLTGIISLAAAFLYYLLFKKLYSMWAGVLYGVILWTLVFYIFNPIFPNIPPILELELNTIVSTLCLYILYGTFIGYSISYDYYEAKIIEEENEKAEALK